MFSKTLNIIQALCYILIIVGGINWGLVGFFNLNIVDTILGINTVGAKIIYDIIGLAALISVILTTKYTIDNREY